MKFKIKKEVDNGGVWYWTIPQGFLNKLKYIWNPIHLINYSSTQDAYDVWTTLESAKQHIKRWNGGYYKKKYYSKYV